MNKPWIEYYKQTDPYCAPRHRSTSYRITYSELATLLKQYAPKTPATILDIGAGSLEQFNIVPDLKKYDWIIIEPALKKTKIPTCVIKILDTIDKAPHDRTVSVATMLSVTQYLDEGELSEYISQIRLRYAGVNTVIISDININQTSEINDMLVYIWNACRYSYLLKAILYLLKLRFGKYNELRKKYPLRSYSYSELQKIATDNGFKMKVLKKNIGYNFNRTTIILTR